MCLGNGAPDQEEEEIGSSSSVPIAGGFIFSCKITHKITRLRCIYTSVHGYTCIGVFSLTAQAPGLREPAQTPEH